MNIENEKLTITKSPEEILQLLILQRREDLIDSIERYNNFKFAGGTGDEGKIRSRLNSLFYTIKAPLKNNKQKEWFNKAKEQLADTKTKVEVLLDIYEENWEFRIETHL